MIRLRFKYLFMSLLLISTYGIESYAQYEEIKEINKTFSKTSNSTLSIYNKYGNVHVNTHTGNDIKVDAVIKVETGSQSRTKQILNNIKIEVIEGNNIIFKTLANVQKSNGQQPRIQSLTGMKPKDKKLSFEINYFVSMPKTLPLTLKNSFGGVYLADHDAKLNVDVGYGDFKADRMTGTADKYVKVRFGNATIDYLQQGTLNISYSPFSLTKAGKVTLRNDYSDCNLGTVSSLNLENKGGSLRINQVANLRGESAYSKFRVGTLTKSLKLYTKSEGSVEIQKIAKSFQSVEIESKYTNIHLNFESGSNYRFEIDSKYGKIHLDHTSSNINKEIRSHSNTYYEGRYGTSSNPSAKVSILSEYGNVNLK